MGGWQGFVAGWHWLGAALIATTFAGQASAGTQSRLSQSVSLFGAGAHAAALPMSLACSSSKCAAFYVDVEAGNRIGGVLLDALGAPIEASRVDFGRSNGFLRVVAVGENFVLAFSDPTAPSGLKVLLLDAGSLGVTRDLSSAEVGRNVRAMYSDGKTVLLLDSWVDDVATTIELASGTVIGREAIDHRVEPLVIPGTDQYLFFYPTYNSFRRLSSLTGAWLGELGSVTPVQLRSVDGGGYFRDGVYQLLWHPSRSPTGGTDDPLPLLGIRVSAADGKVIETDGDGKPAPRVLCEDCPASIQGAFQLGDANYFWLGPPAGPAPQALLKVDPATGLRSDPTLTAADLTLADSPAISELSPLVEPRLLSAEGSTYVANTANLAGLVAGEPQLPGKTSGVKPASLRAASNGESFVVAWNADHVLRASWVSAKPKPALAIDAVSSQELGFPELIDFQIASAHGKYLIVGIHEQDDHHLDLLWRVMDSSGNLGSLNTEPTATVLTQWQVAMLGLGSDSERYLLALFVGDPEKSDGTIVAQRLSAEGEPQEALTAVASGVVALDGVEANYAAPESERRFAVVYRVAEGNELPSYLRTTSSTGALAFVQASLSPYQYVLANDGHSLLLGGAALLNLDHDPLTAREVPSTELSGLSHWDGNAYVRLTNNGALTVNEVSPNGFKVDGQELQVTAEFVQGFAAAAADGKGRSLVAYFASEGPDYTAALRGALLETASDELNGEGGASGDGGAGDGGSSGEAGSGEPANRGGTASLAGATNGAGRSGSAGRSGGDAGSSQQDDDAGDGDRRSRACGCSLPGIEPSNPSIAALALLAVAFSRRRRRRARSRDTNGGRRERWRRRFGS